MFADQQGNIVHLFERECSIQGGIKKSLKNPLSLDDSKLRQEMGRVAINAAKAVGYQEASTVGLLLIQQGRFYFMKWIPGYAS
ncbi:MAG: hypothetical protein IPP67_00310 [Rhodospirillaceae bacterium]|nr:hypothetical protein [Rhodospirillaceae bacterium]